MMRYPAEADNIAIPDWPAQLEEAEAAWSENHFPAPRAAITVCYRRYRRRYGRLILAGMVAAVLVAAALIELP
jgi:hypothetical protein